MSRGSGRIIGQRIRIRPCDDESASSGASSPLDLPSVSSACTPPSTIPSICNATSSPDPHCGSSDPKLPRSGKVLSRRHDAWRVWLSMRALRVAVTKPRARADCLRKFKPYVQALYGTWHENMLDQPFYRVNSRTLELRGQSA